MFDDSKKKYQLQKVLLLVQKGINFIKYFIPRMVKICFILKKLKIDIVHMNNIPVLTDFFLACKFLRIKCVSHIRGNWRPNSIEKKMVQYYDAIISISKSVAEYTKLDNLPNFKIVYNGIDIDKILSEKRKKKDEIREDFGLEENCFFIGIIGNIKDWKGQHVAIEAMNLIRYKKRNIKCVIIGDVSNIDQDQKYFRYLKSLIMKYNLEREIIFSGFRKDSFDIINSLDILLHTSVAPEPFGRVILEGMVFGKPVIATAHGGPVEIIEDGVSGFLVPPNDPSALAEKIEYLIENQNLLKKINEQAQNRVREYFGIKTNIKKLELIYRDLISGIPIRTTN